jgi:hypothetical protein
LYVLVSVLAYSSSKRMEGTSSCETFVDFQWVAWRCALHNMNIHNVNLPKRKALTSYRKLTFVTEVNMMPFLGHDTAQPGKASVGC